MTDSVAMKQMPLDDAYGHHFGFKSDVCVQCGRTAEQCVDNPQPCIR